MITQGDQRPWADVLYLYQEMISAQHPDHVARWPLLNGWNVISASYKKWRIAVLKDAPFSVLSRMSGAGELASETVGWEDINSANMESVLRNLEKHFIAEDRDAIIIYEPDNFSVDLNHLQKKHERAMGLAPMKIFLSHKGADKPKVREFKNTLELLGFSPWLDEDSMTAGVELERGILNGFKDSCAAVFFITENFKDENYLSTEVNYAIAEKRKKGNRFSIITLVFNSSEARGNIPELLHQYVWKEPKENLEALREIVRALPIQLGQVHWK